MHSTQHTASATDTLGIATTVGTTGSPTTAGTIVPPAPAPVAQPPLTPAEVVAALDPALVNSLAALRADLKNWIAAGRALLDRAKDQIIDAARK